MIGFGTVSFAQVSVVVNTIIDPNGSDCIPDMEITYEYPAGNQRTANVTFSGGNYFVDFFAPSVFDIHSITIEGSQLQLLPPGTFWHTFGDLFEYCCDGVLYRVEISLTNNELLLNGSVVQGGGIVCPQDDNNDPQN